MLLLLCETKLLRITVFILRNAEESCIMDVNNYWDDIDIRLEELVRNGSVKLPSLRQLPLDSIAMNISGEMNGSTFSELCSSHASFLSQLQIENYLTPKLLDIAQRVMGYKGTISNQYHIARRIEPGNSKEMFRAHFDSHLFTMVLPIKIPTAVGAGTAGELVYFPNARSLPANNFSDTIGKAYYKRYASKTGIEKFSANHKVLIDNFQDYQPLLFVGNTTLHTNKQVSSSCSSYRLTLLAHFFDPSPKHSIGRVLRFLRAR